MRALYLYNQEANEYFEWWGKFLWKNTSHQFLKLSIST
jgi:hypothetical protein